MTLPHIPQGSTHCFPPRHCRYSRSHNSPRHSACNDIYQNQLHLGHAAKIFANRAHRPETNDASLVLFAFLLDFDRLPSLTAALQSKPVYIAGHVLTRPLNIYRCGISLDRAVQVKWLHSHAPDPMAMVTGPALTGDIAHGRRYR